MRSRIPHTSAGIARLGQRALVILLVGTLTGMAAMYFMFVNVRVTKGFEIRSLEKRLTELEKQHDQLQLEAAQLQAIQSIETSTNQQGYVPLSSPSYLNPSGVALSRQ